MDPKAKNQQLVIPGPADRTTAGPGKCVTPAAR